MTDISVTIDRRDDPPAEDSPRQAAPIGPGDAIVLLELEQPQPGTVILADESLLGFGWALASSPITAIEVELDGQLLCSAVTGLARTDVAEAHPDHPHSARAGFTFVTRLPPRASGAADLRLIVRTATGERPFVLPIEIAGGAEPPRPPAE